MKNKKYAFTLAEVMIVLTVIGILTAIIMPSAFHASPDENVMKFKKANATFMSVIRELVQSNQYYYNGDLGTLSSKEEVGTLNTEEGDTKAQVHFCQTLGDILSYKKINCQSTGYTTELYASILPQNATENDTDALKTKVDEICASSQSAITNGYEIITPDGIYWYQASPQAYFSYKDAQSLRIFSKPGEEIPEKYQDAFGFDANYKVFCIDVDGTGEEAPFGYGIRADGKIITGARADEWITKSVQKCEEKDASSEG
ncbi:type II secretion system protein [bacterium]|nr:type II secretion system protein [bacterium]